MNITDGIKMNGKPFIIPDSSRNDLPEFFKEQGFKTGAEIGVYKGDFTRRFCEAGLKMYAIDPWTVYGEFGLAEQALLESYYEVTVKKLQPYKNATIIRKSSMDALSDIPDQSLDFVYIDGDHRFKYVADDISEWSKKVKPTGLICGHDYIYPDELEKNRMLFLQVKPVVDAYVEANMIEDLYILGNKRDRHLSWIFRNDYIRDDLTKLAIKYGTDRHPESKHSYTPFYFDLLRAKRDNFKKVLEIGVGEGPGLRMWRDFFPNAKIYGAEIDPKRIFQDARINIFCCDQSSKEDLKILIQEIGSDIDLVVEDGSHKPQDQITTCLTLMPLLNKNVIYVIEDVADPSIVEALTDYDITIPNLYPKKTRYDDRLIIVRHKR